MTLDQLSIVDWGNTNLTKAAYEEDGKFLAVSASGCDGRIGYKEHSKHTPVLSAIGAQCGRMFFPDEDFTAIKNTITLTPREGKCDAKFLYYLLTFVELPKRGAGQPFISKGDIQNFSVTIPAPREQKRIADLLDKAFAGLASVQASNEKNLQYTRALFKSYVEKVFAENGEKISFGEILQLEYGKPLDRSDRKSDGRYPVYGANGEKDRTDKYFFDKPSVIVGRKGSAGEVNLTESKFWPLDVTYFVKFDDRHYDLIFLYYLLKRLNLPSFAKGVKPGINRNEVYAQIVSVPLLPEQKRAVESVETLRKKVQRLEVLYREKIAATDALKKSLLHQAFEGKLLRTKVVA